MKVMVVVHYPMFGGPHNRALNLNRALAAHDWQTIAVLPDEPGTAAARLRAGGVEVVQLPLRRVRASLDPRLQLAFGFGFAGDVRRLRRLMRTRSVDLVIVAGLVNPHAALAARLEHKPVVWQIVDSRTPALIRRLSMLLVDRMANAVMYCGHALVGLHLNQRHPGVPSFVCPPAVDLDRFIPSPERRRQTRGLLRIPEGAAVVGTVANLVPMKGIEYFVRAAAEIYQGRPDAWFLVVGTAFPSQRAYHARLLDEVHRSPIPAERWLFVGERSDVENFYPAMDVKLITSVPRSEGTTTTAIEAHACGIPVVAARIGAVAEVVEDGVTGFVVPPLDPGALASKTLSLLNNPSIRGEMGLKGRQRVQPYSIDASRDRYLEVFETAMGHHLSQQRPKSQWKRAS